MVIIFYHLLFLLQPGHFQGNTYDIVSAFQVINSLLLNLGRYIREDNNKQIRENELKIEFQSLYKFFRNFLFSISENVVRDSN